MILISIIVVSVFLGIVFGTARLMKYLRQRDEKVLKSFEDIDTNLKLYADRERKNRSKKNGN